MSTNQVKSSESRYLFLIALLSIAIPVVVAFLYIMPKDGSSNVDVSMLPGLHAILNSLTALCLILGYVQIRKGNRTGHRNFMAAAFVLSSLFLISYVTYHSLGQETKYGGEGALRYIYFFILITHIILAAVIVPLVLTSIYFALTKQFTRHRRISRWTFPLWLYVAISGVLVYALLSPYYA